MKILLFITGHRQLKEYHYFNVLLKRLTIDCDIYIYCNNPDISGEIVEYYQQFQQINKRLFITSLNNGYTMGAIEAISESLNMGIFHGYDYVIHLHPDVFLTDDTYLLELLNKHLKNETVFLVNRCFPDDQEHFSVDFFIFKPKLLRINIFISELYTYKYSPEKYLFYVLRKYNIMYQVVKRFNNDCWYPRRIDDHLKLYHEHDLTKVEELISLIQ